MPGNIDLDGAQCDLEGSARDIRVVYRTRSHIGRWLRYGLPLSPGRSFQTLRSPWSLAGPALRRPSRRWPTCSIVSVEVRHCKDLFWACSFLPKAWAGSHILQIPSTCGRCRHLGPERSQEPGPSLNWRARRATLDHALDPASLGHGGLESSMTARRGHQPSFASQPPASRRPPSAPCRYRSPVTGGEQADSVRSAARGRPFEAARRERGDERALSVAA